MENKQKLPTEEIEQIMRELRENYNEEFEDFCTEFELMVHIFFGGKIYRNCNEFKIYLPDKQKYRIIVEQISKKK